jgi:hypothetical protein
MFTLSALLFENGLPNLPVLLIEPHRNHGGVWRIKFSYETSEPLSMSAVQASTMASRLNKIGQVELADEIDGGKKCDALRVNVNFCIQLGRHHQT